nr:MAG TPA: hypothetical protein [Caudoviricetes sp.]
MANLVEIPQWEDGIYQIETSDPVLGGPGGIANKQAEQLGNRTAFLKEQITSVGNDLKEHVTVEDPHPQYVDDTELTARLSEIRIDSIHRVTLTEDDWTQDSANGRYTKTLVKTAATDTCVSVCDSTGNRLIVNIAETDEQIVLTALAPVAGYAVISGSGGNTVQTVVDPSEDDTDTNENEE